MNIEELQDVLMKEKYGDDWYLWSFTSFCQKFDELQVENKKADVNNPNNNQTLDINKFIRRSHVQ